MWIHVDTFWQSESVSNVCEILFPGGTCQNNTDFQNPAPMSIQMKDRDLPREPFFCNPTIFNTYWANVEVTKCSK